MVVNFRNFPILKTERLVLRNVENTDADLIYKLHSDPVVNKFVGRDNSASLQKAKEYTIKMQNLIDNNECIYWIIRFQENNDLIGSICLWNFDRENNIVEIGYEMLPEFQGKGLMSEAIQKVTKYAFDEMKAAIITAFPSSDNNNSVAILKKMNFEFEDKKYNNTHENVANSITYTLRNNKI
jgi:ribosomal-protein-alanine N-acetyltransferase